MIVDSRNEQPVQRVKDLVLQYFEGRNVRASISSVRGPGENRSGVLISI